ncbi:MAG: biopolymer transporter ExbD [Gammaproteobacteria bacterium]|nr:biopolymer transporter ExbD [Gammaproteobacteria bacterium]
MQLSLPRKKSLVNLTPLIDVVFILLIFFMLASNFIRWHYIELSVGKIEDFSADQNELSIIKISSNGEYQLNDEILLLDSIILKMRKQIGNDANHSIVIQPEEGANVQTMVDVLNSLKNFASDNISVAKPAKQNL